jgi:hypothetical protein
MQMVRVDIDRMFDDVTIGRPLAKGHRISVANHSPVSVGDKMRQPMLLHVLTPLPEVREFRCVESIASRRIDANPDMMKIDRNHRVDVLVTRGPHDDIGRLIVSVSIRSFGTVITGSFESFDSFLHDIGMKTDGAGFVYLAIKFLNLGFEPGENISAPFEGFKILDHRPRPFTKSFAGHNRRDTGRINDEERCRDASLDLIDRKIIDIVAHEMTGGLARRHDRLRKMLGRKLRLLQGADISFTKKSMHVGAKVPQAHASIAGRAPHDKFRHDIGERRIVVVKAFESHKSADESAWAISASSKRRAFTTWKPICSIAVMIC